MLGELHDKIFQKANAEGDRTLTEYELSRVYALNFTIANTEATSRKDVAIQAKIAAEIGECHCDGQTPHQIWVESLAAAMHSISAILSPAPRRRA